MGKSLHCISGQAFRCNLPLQGTIQSQTHLLQFAMTGFPLQSFLQHCAKHYICAMKEVLIIDNYDSFTYNLVHYLEDLNAKVTVFRNDEFELDEVARFDKILLSPGPGLPSDAGLLKSVIQKYASSKSILGICLGLQAIGEVFGAKLLNVNKVYHGVETEIIVLSSEESLFKNLPNQFHVGRYHSWIVDANDLPTDLEITSIDEKVQIMSLQHKIYDVKGVQFHPESILTPNGKEILANWLAR